MVKRNGIYPDSVDSVCVITGGCIVVRRRCCTCPSFVRACVNVAAVAVRGSSALHSALRQLKLSVLAVYYIVAAELSVCLCIDLTTHVRYYYYYLTYILDLHTHTPQICWVSFGQLSKVKQHETSAIVDKVFSSTGVTYAYFSASQTT